MAPCGWRRQRRIVDSGIYLPETTAGGRRQKSKTSRRERGNEIHSLWSAATEQTMGDCRFQDSFDYRRNGGRQRDKSRREQRVSEVEKEGERETGTTLCIDRAARFNVDLCKRIMDAKSALRITRRDCELLDATIRRLGRRK